MAFFTLVNTRLCCIVVFLSYISSRSTSAQNTFDLGGLFTTDIGLDPITRESYGVYPLEAAKMAVDHVTTEGWLAAHGYKLNLFNVETSCDPAGAAIATLKFVEEMGVDEDTPFALLGPICSIAAELMASISSQYSQNVHISYGTLSPIFSDVNTYSHFYRTVPSYSSFDDPILAVMQFFDWQQVGIVHTESAFYTLSLEDLARLFRSQNYPAQIVVSLGLSAHLQPSDRAKSDDVRIYIAMVEEKSAADTLCAAYLNGLTGKTYLWILLGDYTDGWWKQVHNKKCTQKEMLSAVESTLILTHTVQIPYKVNAFTSIRGQSLTEFWNEFGAQLKSNTGLTINEERTVRVLQSYDAVWSVAKALNQTLSDGITNFTNTTDPKRLPFESSLRVQRLHSALNNNMKKLNFAGASGKITFTEESNSPKMPTTLIFQMQNGSMVPIGIHTEEVSGNLLNLSYFDNQLLWQGKNPPRDRPLVIQQVVEFWLVCLMLCLTLLGIIFAIVILILNCVYRKHKVIKASSPYINIVIIIGCMLGFCSIPILSVENLDIFDYIPPTAYLYICNARPWILSISLTLSFGALFAKTWRVYMIFRNPWVKKRPYKDPVLLVIVAALLVIDVIVLALWSGLFPLRLTTVFSPTDTEQFIHSAYRICIIGDGVEDTALIAWLAVVSILKGLLFLFGIFLVVQTSKIKAKFFQESKYIGIAIYGVVVTCGPGVPVVLSLMYNLEEDLGYVCVTSLILINCFLILAVVFIPRLLLLKKYKHNVPSAVLIGLNPSFRVKRNQKYFVGKKPARRERRLSSGNSFNTTSCTVLETTSETPNSFSSQISYLTDTTSASTDNLIGRSLESMGWEPAYDEGAPANNVTVEAEVENPDVPYTSYVNEDGHLSANEAHSVRNPLIQAHSSHDGDTVICGISVAVPVHVHTANT